MLIQTDDPVSPSVILHSAATVRPRASIEELARDGTVMIGKTATVRLAAHSHGTESKLPLPLDDRSVSASLPIKWVTSQTNETDHRTGWVSNRREFELVCRGEGEPGPRRTVAEVRESGELLARAMVRWEVAPAVSTSPSGLILTRDDLGKLKTICVRSQDGHPFRILSTSSQINGVIARPRHAGALTLHSLEVRVPLSARHVLSGDIVIATDHPLQPTSKVSVFLAEAN